MRLKRWVRPNHVGFFFPAYMDSPYADAEFTDCQPWFCTLRIQSYKTDNTPPSCSVYSSGRSNLMNKLNDRFFSPFIFISWGLITLQYCSGFCHTLT